MSTQQDRIRGYVGNLGAKAPVVVVAVANKTLEGEQTIDGVTTSESRVLLTGQTDPIENGIYVTATGTWTRAADFDGDYDANEGTLIPVAQGTTYKNSIWMFDTADAEIDTDSLDFIMVFNGVEADLLFQTLTDGATISWDVHLGAMGSVTLAGNRTFAAPTNMVAGKAYALIVKQDATGSRTITWNSVFKWPSATPPTLSTGANAIDVFSFLYDGTNLYGVIQKAFG